MPARHASLHRIRLSPQAVSEALTAVREFQATASLVNCDVVAIIVEELVLNLCDYGERTGDFIELAFSLEEEGVRVRLSDGCAPFDPRTDRPAVWPPPEDGSSAGAGNRLVRALSTIEAYERIGGQNTLRLLIGHERLR